MVGEAGLGFAETAEPVQAEVVRPALHVGGAHVQIECARQVRKILVEDLILERPRSRGYEHALPGQHRRDEIRERLARSRARFGDECAARIERACDGVGQLSLTRPGFEVRNRRRQGPAVGERFRDAVRQCAYRARPG